MMSKMIEQRPSWSIDLDAVRGAAALFVVLSHIRNLFFVTYDNVQEKSQFLSLAYGLTDLGAVAVTIFFVMSGYLISSSILRMRERQAWNWPLYATHRLIRLYIVLLPALVLTAVWDSAGLTLHGHSAIYAAWDAAKALMHDYSQSPMPAGRIEYTARAPIAHFETLSTWIGNLFYLQGIVCPTFGSDTPLWSLSYEFWYYALFPIGLVIFAWNKSFGVRAVCAVLGIGILALVGRSIIGHFGVWLLGSAVAALERLNLTLRARTIGKSVLWIILLCTVAVTQSMPFHSLHGNLVAYIRTYAVGIAFASWLSAVVSGKRTAQRPETVTFYRSLGSNIAKFLADRSYTLYLVHMPILFFINATILPKGNTWQPNLYHLLLAACVLGGVLAYAFGVWMLTEAHTDRLRAFFERKFLSTSKTARGSGETSNPSAGASPRILVYQIGSLGDTLVAVPSYKAIRRYFGETAWITVLHNIPPDVRAMPQQVLVGSGLVSEFIGFRQTNGRSSLRDSLDLWKKIAPVKADAVVYLAPAERGKRAVQRDRLFFKLCGVREAIGFHAYDAELFLAHNASGIRQSVPHEARLRLDRLKRDGIDGELSAESARLTLPRAAIDSILESVSGARQWPEREIIAIAPGANQPAKYWPLDRFKEIGHRLLATEKFELIVVGGPREREAAEALLSAWGSGMNFAGKLSVVETGALIGLCRMLIGLDTGTTHLAAAVGTRTIALYADRDPVGQWLPIGTDHIVLRREVKCGGCGLKECNQPGHPCMTGITVDDVWHAVQQAIKADEPSVVHGGTSGQ